MAEAGTFALLEAVAKHFGIKRLMFVIFLITLTVLLAPQHTLAILRLSQLIEKHYAWVVVLCASSGVFWLSYPVFAAGNYCSRKIQDWKLDQKLRRRLEHLAPDEKVTLRTFVPDGRTRNIDRSDGVVNNLVSAGILHEASSRAFPGRNATGDRVVCLAYSINRVALEYLRKHPELLR